MGSPDILTKRPTTPEELAIIRTEVISSFSRGFLVYQRIFRPESNESLTWDNTTATGRRLATGYNDLITGLNRVLKASDMNSDLPISFYGDPVYDEMLVGENSARTFQIQSGIPTEGLVYFLGYEIKRELDKKHPDLGRWNRMETSRTIIAAWSDPLHIREQFGEEGYKAWIRREILLIHDTPLKDSPLEKGWQSHAQDDRGLAELAYSRRRLLVLP